MRAKALTHRRQVEVPQRLMKVLILARGVLKGLRALSKLRQASFSAQIVSVRGCVLLGVEPTLRLPDRPQKFWTSSKSNVGGLT